MDQYLVSLNALKYTDLKDKLDINYSGDIIVFDAKDLSGPSVTFENITFLR